MNQKEIFLVDCRIWRVSSIANTQFPIQICKEYITSKSTQQSAIKLSNYTRAWKYHENIRWFSTFLFCYHVRSSRPSLLLLELPRPDRRGRQLFVSVRNMRLVVVNFFGKFVSNTTSSNWANIAFHQETCNRLELFLSVSLLTISISKYGNEEEFL